MSRMDWPSDSIGIYAEYVKWAGTRSSFKARDQLLLHAKLGKAVLDDFKDKASITEDFNAFVADFTRLTRLGASLEPVSTVDPGGYRESIHSIHMAARWAGFGFNVFELTEDLAASFILTEPPPVPEEGLKLPFPCFAVSIPAGVVPVFVGQKQTWARLIWVHEFGGYHVREGFTRFLRVMATRDTTQVWRDRFPSKISDTTDETIFNRVDLGDPEYLPEDRLSAEAAVRVVRNLVSWLEAGDKPLRKKPAKKKKGKKAKRLEASGVEPRVWLMGSEVKIRPELKRFAGEMALGASKNHEVEGWRVRSRHVVRGHWKSQAYGPGKTLRKRVWIAPYWRGPEGSEVWAHVYR